MKLTFRKLSNPRSIAQKTLEIVLAEEHYDQQIWLSAGYFTDWDDEATGEALRATLNRNVCGTTGCVAGNVVILTLDKNDRYDYVNQIVRFKDGGTQYVMNYAQKKLGITYDQADWLFSEDRTRDDVVEALTLLSKGKSIQPMVDDWI